MAESSKSQPYETDEDGYPRAKVGPWVHNKYARLARYIGISRSVRAKFIGENDAGASYIELFSGPGRVRVRDETRATHGSPLVAWHESLASGAAFTEIHVADDNAEFADAVEVRLKNAGAPCFVEKGPATETVKRVISRLNPNALHFAFLDPYNLEHLNFEVIRKLAAFKRMDILVHVSISDLQRNLGRYIGQDPSPLDSFAPGWRDHVDVTRTPSLVRGKILEYWRGILKNEEMDTTESAELVSGTKNQRLYFLAFAARHALALEFWNKIRNISTDRQLNLFDK